MRPVKTTKAFLISALLAALTAPAWGDFTVEISDTSTPIRIDGDLSDWTAPPAITFDKKEQVVSGQNDWNSSADLRASIFLSYDKDNLYVGADITSKTPQFNAQEGNNLYNGDNLELYTGTDLTNPKRTTYAPTDVQLFISPGKNGENPAVFSATDKAPIPNAKVATKLTKTGYTLEASIPLKFFYKINVGPGKTIGFDCALDDVGASSKARDLQMCWTQQPNSWQDASQFGTLTFKGNTVYVNSEPKVAMPNAAANQELDPKAGAKNASTDGVLLWGFNGDLGGFSGSVSLTTDITSEGTGALLINADGSQGWNQNLALTADIPSADKWTELKLITLDVYFPVGSLAKSNYTEVYLVTQSQANNWNEIKMKAQEGWNHFKNEVDASQFKGIYKMYIVLNSGGPIQGSVIVDNIRGVYKGATAELKGTVSAQDGKPISGVIIAVSKKLVNSAADGTFDMNIPSDEYTAEAFCPGFDPYKENIKVNSNGVNTWNPVLKPSEAIVKSVVADVYFDKKVRTINPHYIFGNNLAAWDTPKWYTDPIAVERVKAITSYIRVPGGAYGNIWDWKTGQVMQKDGVSISWTPDFRWPDMVDFLKKNNFEPILIANIMTRDVQYCLDWIADAKARGLNVKYVEMGNEPDYEPDMSYQGQNQYWTVIDNYCKHYLEFAKAIRAKYPEIKLMGPACAQVSNRERKEGSPWLATDASPWWVEKFLEECGAYVDVVSVHTYPYWNNDSDSALLSKENLWQEYVPKIREAIKKNIPDRYNQIEISVSEWNSGDENSTTARLVNGVFCADFIGQMMLWGINQTNIWDLYTQKPGQGGGHGVLDPMNDPDRPYAERSSYWSLYMLEHYFGTTMYQAVSSNSDYLSVYASSDGKKKYLLFVNKDPKYTFKTSVNMGKSVKGKMKLDFYRLSSKEYQWSENLYRAVINTGPSHLKGNLAVGSHFEASFPPYSITCIEMTPAKK